MSTEKTVEQVMELAERFICLRPKLIPPEHVLQFKKKMQALKSSGYSSGDHAFVYRLLITLAHSGEALSMGKLSAELELPMSTATRIVDWLVNAGMLERVNDPNDRRMVRVGISKAGREFYESGLEHNKKRIARLIKDFTSEEQVQLLHLMNKLFNTVKEEIDSGA
jgi:DNA-binding MarR family transcriptional regulator